MKGRSGGSHPRPGLPTVNLLSQSALDAIAVRRLWRRFAAAAAVLAVLVGAAWLVQHQRVSNAQELVAVEQAQTERLAGQAQELAAIKAFVAGVAGQKLTVAATMAQEVYLSRVLTGVRSASPAGTSLQSIAVTLAPAAVGATEGAAAAGASTAVCPGPDPFQTEQVVGCVTLSGTADSRAEVGKLVTRLGEMGMFVEPFISTTTTGDSQEVTFTGSVGLSPKVYSGRYLPMAAGGES